ncbi:MAG: metalloregulator ArsR/SmtB family transcription factor [Polyangia bacterium]
MLDADRVRAARDGIPAADVVNEAIEVFKALANPIRVRILHALAHDELSVGDLAHAFELPLSTVSHQLSLLRRVRLVASRDEGRLTIYRATDQFVGRLVHDALGHAVTRIPGAHHHHPHGVKRKKRR